MFFRCHKLLASELDANVVSQGFSIDCFVYCVKPLASAVLHLSANLFPLRKVMSLFFSIIIWLVGSLLQFSWRHGRCWRKINGQGSRDWLQCGRKSYLLNKQNYLEVIEFGLSQHECLMLFFSIIDFWHPSSLPVIFYQHHAESIVLLRSDTHTHTQKHLC